MAAGPAVLLGGSWAPASVQQHALARLTLSMTEEAFGWPPPALQLAACISGADILQELAQITDNIADILWCS
jgi:hypothetical protein